MGNLFAVQQYNVYSVIVHETWVEFQVFGSLYFSDYKNINIPQFPHSYFACLASRFYWPVLFFLNSVTSYIIISTHKVW